MASIFVVATSGHIQYANRNDNIMESEVGSRCVYEIHFWIKVSKRKIIWCILISLFWRTCISFSKLTTTQNGKYNQRFFFCFFGGILGRERQYRNIFCIYLFLNTYLANAISGCPSVLRWIRQSTVGFLEHLSKSAPILLQHQKNLDKKFGRAEVVIRKKSLQ